jgi:putative membrane protein
MSHSDSAVATDQRRNHAVMWAIHVVSIAVPIVVALLLGIRTKIDLGTWTKVLPHVIGGINSLTSLLLIVGFIAIRNRKVAIHRACMSSAIGLGGAFLVLYVTYHLSNPSTTFGGTGAIRYVYYSILISHILLSLVVLPLVLRAFAYAWCGMFESHRRVAKYAFPIWLYVSTTGVVAYLMISPYYTK